MTVGFGYVYLTCVPPAKFLSSREKKELEGNFKNPVPDSVHITQVQNRLKRWDKTGLQGEISFPCVEGHFSVVNHSAHNQSAMPWMTSLQIGRSHV